MRIQLAILDAKCIAQDAYDRAKCACDRTDWLALSDVLSMFVSAEMYADEWAYHEGFAVRSPRWYTLVYQAVCTFAGESDFHAAAVLWLHANTRLQVSG